MEPLAHPYLTRPGDELRRIFFNHVTCPRLWDNALMRGIARDARDELVRRGEDPGPMPTFKEAIRKEA